MRVPAHFTKVKVTNATFCPKCSKDLTKENNELAAAKERDKAVIETEFGYLKGKTHYWQNQAQWFEYLVDLATT